ncbi:MAG: glutamate mutase L [Candidatus Krumholzibacteria bacterium]|nr:glutamate mutase L [Candidatus Krumholzibacteria bacterium]MDP6668987.1 glutamate mutase L [Candidatus Krumholzibacteria bacterium]MDP6797524.1 glutamate mutase L [Candidatus Krumholzibacteria bacterium]MDP7021371.1 glutamate mutase L [Candidatus Krumholzibacteria bacterium]
MPEKNFQKARSILATDCGSTTTKAILIEEVEGEFRLVNRGEAPTTVEAPFEDVTRGALNAIREVEELRGRQILDGETILSPQEGDRGVDIYISTSSAGGGLQMMVAGVVKSMTGESAERAALGAGAIVMDVLASNDGRLPHQKISRIRQLRPDMILLSGGIDGGTVSHVVELAEILHAANPKPRLGHSYKLPVIYAGNKDARDTISDTLGEITDLDIVDNIRPILERENLQPSRDKIHDLFMEHVMAQAPGYKKLMSWTDAPIMPTPGAVGAIIQTVAEREGITVLGVDIGGATTDVFSVFEGIFNRTVSANLGMSYSVSNVLAEAGLDNVLRWVPMDMDAEMLMNRIGNKMIRPTTIPQSLEELKIEQAIAREALRLSFIQHKEFAVSLKGVQKERTISDAFDQSGSGETLVDMMNLKLLVGSGGVLSHAPRRHQAARMMVDAFLPEGITDLAVDSIFMMPQLGVLSTVHEKAATEVFDKDCLIHLGACIAPVGSAKPGKKLADIALEMPDGSKLERELLHGDMFLIESSREDRVKATLKPAKSIDLGAGKGQEVRTELRGGVVGLIFDGRGRRPFTLPEESSERVAKLGQWSQAVSEYPNETAEAVTS